MPTVYRRDGILPSAYRRSGAPPPAIAWAAPRHPHTVGATVPGRPQEKDKITMLKNENGYIVVETVGTFIPFVFLVISILSLVNIVGLQARVHNALTQAAGTISMYCYVLEATGAANDMMTTDRKAHATGETISAVFGGIGSLTGSGSQTGSESQTGGGTRSGGDFKAIVESLANYGINELKNIAIAQLVSPLVDRYLACDGMTGDEYLKSVRVVKFEITEANVIDKDGNVKLTVEYEIEYTFGALKIPFGPTLKVTQTVVTKAWLGGSGEGYRWR